MALVGDAGAGDVPAEGMRGLANSGVQCTGCGRPHADGSGLCRDCRAGQARRKYRWSAELHEELRAAYRSKTKRGLTMLLDRLCLVTGWPRWAFKSEAKSLGITTHDHRRGWTREEIEYLEKKLGERSTKWIAKRLGRSWESVRSRVEALRLRGRVRTGYTIDDVATCFGVCRDKARRWGERGLLGQPVEGRFREDAVVRFIRAWPLEYDLRRVDQEWFKGMVFGA